MKPKKDTEAPEQNVHAYAFYRDGNGGWRVIDMLLPISVVKEHAIRGAGHEPDSKALSLGYLMQRIERQER